MWFPEQPPRDLMNRLLGAYDDDDILPATFAFAVAAASLGLLVLQVLCKLSLNKEMNKLNGPVKEFLIVVGLNALVMGFSQMNGLTYVKYVVIGLAILMYVRDVWNAHVFSKSPQMVSRALPKVFFGNDFREKYMGAMSGDVTILTADNVYGDFLSTEFRRVLLLAVGQLILLAMFIAGLILRGAPPFEEQQAYVFYWVGIVVEASYMAGKCQLEEPFENYAFFCNALRAARSNNKVGVVKVNEDAGRDLNKNLYVLRYNDGKLWTRFLLSMLVNNTGLLLIMLALPMQLSWSEEPTDFVLNAVAALFVVEIDDLATPVEYRVVNVESSDDGGWRSQQAPGGSNTNTTTITAGTIRQPSEGIVSTKNESSSRRSSEGLEPMIVVESEFDT